MSSTVAQQFWIHNNYSNLVREQLINTSKILALFYGYSNNHSESKKDQCELTTETNILQEEHPDVESTQSLPQ